MRGSNWPTRATPTSFDIVCCISLQNNTCRRPAFPQFSQPKRAQTQAGPGPLLRDRRSRACPCVLCTCTMYPPRPGGPSWEPRVVPRTLVASRPPSPPPPPIEPPRDPRHILRGLDACLSSRFVPFRFVSLRFAMNPLAPGDSRCNGQPCRRGAITGTVSSTSRDRLSVPRYLVASYCIPSSIAAVLDPLVSSVAWPLTYCLKSLSDYLVGTLRRLQNPETDRHFRVTHKFLICSSPAPHLPHSLA